MKFSTKAFAFKLDMYSGVCVYIVHHHYARVNSALVLIPTMRKLFTREKCKLIGENLWSIASPESSSNFQFKYVPLPENLNVVLVLPIQSIN